MVLIIFVYITRNSAIQKINIGKSSPISKRNIKKIIVSINIIIIIKEITTIKKNLRNPK
jgi:hypothetical protein